MSDTARETIAKILSDYGAPEAVSTSYYLIHCSDAERIAMARALVPPGWVVGKVPDMDAAPEEEYGLTEFREGRRVGWNACRAAFIKSGEETT